LDAPVAGVDEIVWDNGITRKTASWATLLDSGILRSDDASRRAAADAVRSDHDGFERVRDAAPASLRPDLERLLELLADSDEAKKRRADPLVVDSVRAVRDATPPDVCGWVR
jgi:hypothetical protein